MNTPVENDLITVAREIAEQAILAIVNEEESSKIQMLKLLVKYNAIKKGEVDKTFIDRPAHDEDLPF